MESLNKECLAVSKIEKFVLHLLLNQVEFEQIEKHIHRCKKCHDIFTELRIFYNVLIDEIEKPVANNIFHLVKILEQNKIIITGILLKPQLLDEKPGERHFTSEIILSTLDNELSDFKKLDCYPLHRDEILIRAIQSIDTHETTLFLYAQNKKLYSEVTVKFPKTEFIFKSDKKGKVEAGNVDVKKFYNQPVMIVYNN